MLTWGILACSSGIEKKKFDGALKAAQAAQESLDNLDDYETFTRVFDAFANEVIALRDKVRTKRSSSSSENILTFS